MAYTQLDWDNWWADECKRRQDAADRAAQPKRRSIMLTDARMAQIDYHAELQGMDRHQFTEHVFKTYFASWRPLHRDSH